MVDSSVSAVKMIGLSRPTDPWRLALSWKGSISIFIHNYIILCKIVKYMFELMKVLKEDHIRGLGTGEISYKKSIV